MGSFIYDPRLRNYLYRKFSAKDAGCISAKRPIVRQKAPSMTMEFSIPSPTFMPIVSGGKDLFGKHVSVSIYNYSIRSIVYSATNPNSIQT